MPNDKIWPVINSSIRYVECERRFEVIAPCILGNCFLPLVVRGGQATRKNAAGKQNDEDTAIHDYKVNRLVPGTNLHNSADFGLQ